MPLAHNAASEDFAPGKEAPVQCREEQPCDDDADGGDSAKETSEQRSPVRVSKGKGGKTISEGDGEGYRDEYGDDDEYLEQIHYQDATEPDAAPPMSTWEVIFEMIDENGRLIFGGGVLLFLTCCFVPLFMAIGTAGPDDRGDGAAPEKQKETPATKSKTGSKAD